MAQGKGSAMAILTLLLILLIQSEIAQAATVKIKTYNVGDAKGWTFNVNTWTKGKKFHAGELLVFKYPKALHNVVALNENKVAYNWCLKTKSSKAFQTGNDTIKLIKGWNYFICTIPGHCKAGLKMGLFAF